MCVCIACGLRVCVGEREGRNREEHEGDTIRKIKDVRGKEKDVNERSLQITGECGIFCGESF